MIDGESKFYVVLRKVLKWLFLFLGFVILVLIFFGQEILTFLWHDLPFMGSDFDPKVWFAALDCKNLHDEQCAYKYENCDRVAMYHDLEQNYLFIGTPKAKVNKLLGKGVTNQNNADCFEYPLGFCGRKGNEFLSVCYDKNEKLKSENHY
jgi:hypothetical protein